MLNPFELVRLSLATAPSPTPRPQAGESLFGPCTTCSFPLTSQDPSSPPSPDIPESDTPRIPSFTDQNTYRDTRDTGRDANTGVLPGTPDKELAGDSDRDRLRQ